MSWRRRLWIGLSLMLPFAAGAYASQGRGAVFWAVLAVWAGLGFALAVWDAGERRGPNH